MPLSALALVVLSPLLPPLLGELAESLGFRAAGDSHGLEGIANLFATAYLLVAWLPLAILLGVLRGRPRAGRGAAGWLLALAAVDFLLALLAAKELTEPNDRFGAMQAAFAAVGLLVLAAGALAVAAAIRLLEGSDGAAGKP